jgi:WD40 repeat protein
VTACFFTSCSTLANNIEQPGDLHSPKPKVIPGTFVAFSHDGKSFVTSNGKSSSLTLYDAADFKPIREFTGPPNNRPITAAFSLDNAFLAPAWFANNQPIRLFSVATGQQLHELEECRWRGEPFAFSPNGKPLQCASTSSTLLVQGAPAQSAFGISGQANAFQH